MKILELFKRTIELETLEILENLHKFGDEVNKAVELILMTRGKVVVTGVGKSGHIGKKIAASFSSTGTPSFFMHATEGVHGDLGMITKDDLVLLLSNSGETNEVINLFPSLNQIGCKKIAISRSHKSTMAKNSDVSIAYQYKEEADHLHLAPTTSSTIMLIIGDALCTTVCELRNFTKEDFHIFHPGGSLGKSLEGKK